MLLKGLNGIKCKYISTQSTLLGVYFLPAWLNTKNGGHLSFRTAAFMDNFSVMQGRWETPKDLSKAANWTQFVGSWTTLLTTHTNQGESSCNSPGFLDYRALPLGMRLAE